MTQRLFRIVADFQDGTHHDEEFTRPMNLFLNTPLGNATGSWLKHHGPVRSLTYAGAEIQRHDIILRYRVILGDEPYWFSFRLIRDGKIAQMLWW
jgi:hypothetical protein